MVEEKDFRIEKDSLGEFRILANVYWGAQTQRAVENFPISGIGMPREFIRAIGLVKMAASETNLYLDLLDQKISSAITRAAKEVFYGKWDAQFPVDIFQTGSGTSTNMNANEVIANRATEILGGRLGGERLVHPNDHVNMGQSSNDVFPTSIHIAAVESLQNRLIPVLLELKAQLEEKSKAFDSVVKLGRTHLQDAVPMRMGQAFGGYAAMVSQGIDRITHSLDGLLELALGGTAVGTGINTDPRFAGMVIRKINTITDFKFREAGNHFEAQGARDAIVFASGALKTLAVSLMKIANDIRWLGSGPYGGIGELIIPAVQPGSSIMPGKVNPVMAESLIQVAAQVIGNEAAITIGGLSGNFELNVMMPMMAHNLLSSIELLAKGVRVFTEKCLIGLQVDEKRSRSLVDKSLAMVTALAPVIGYDKAAEIAKKAHQTGKTLVSVILETGALSAREVEKVLDPMLMTGPVRKKDK